MHGGVKRPKNTFPEPGALLFGQHLLSEAILNNVENQAGGF